MGAVNGKKNTKYSERSDNDESLVFQFAAELQRAPATNHHSALSQSMKTSILLFIDASDQHICQEKELSLIHILQ